MITLSDGMEVAMPVGIPLVGLSEDRGVSAGTRARIAATEGDGNRLSRLRTAGAVVWSDVSGAWVWRGSPPTLRDLWLARTPALDAVPAGSRVLHAAWVGWNHVALVPTAVLSTVVWILQHPARFGLAALVVAPIIAMWIF